MQLSLVAIFVFFAVIVFVVICLNALVWWVRGRHTRRKFPERKSGYKRLISWFVGYSAVICGLFQIELINEKKSILDFLVTESLGVYGLIAAILTFAISPLFGLFIYKFKGAEELAMHPGLLNTFVLHVNEEWIWKASPIIIFLSHLGFIIFIINFNS